MTDDTIRLLLAFAGMSLGAMALLAIDEMFNWAMDKVKNKFRCVRCGQPIDSVFTALCADCLEQVNRPKKRTREHAH